MGARPVPLPMANYFFIPEKKPCTSDKIHHPYWFIMIHTVIRVIAIFLLAGLAFHAVCAEGIQDAAIWGNKGKALINTNENAAALEAFDQALQLDPFYAEGWVLRGDVLVRLERYADAADSYDRALAIDKTNADIMGRKAKVLSYLGRNTEALDLYQRAISLNPNIFTNLDGLADVLASLNRFSEANEAYDTALKASPQNNATWNKKGLVLARMFLNREAVEAFNKSLQIYPDSAEVWNNMGGALFSQGKMKEALNAFENAIALDKRYIPQKYEDTLNILESNRDKRSGIAGTEEAVIPEVVSQFLLPPPIFILNYLMIGTGVILIITLGFARLVHGRTVRKKNTPGNSDNPEDSPDTPSSGGLFKD